MTDLPHAKAFTAEDRLRLHTHDPETFTFDISDALSLEEELDQLRDAHTRALVEAEARGIERAAKLIESGYEREIVQFWNRDWKPSKNDACRHGQTRREDCESCAVIAIRKLMEKDNG